MRAELVCCVIASVLSLHAEAGTLIAEQPGTGRATTDQRVVAAADAGSEPREPVNSAETEDYPAPTVTSISPDWGVNNEVVSVRIHGARFRNGVSVRLGGMSTIRGGSVYLYSDGYLSTSFDIRGATPGEYDVVVTNDDGQSGVLRRGFTIVVPHAVTITEQPSGSPNPVASGGEVDCSVEAEDSRSGHTIEYAWTATDGSGRSAGSFGDADWQDPTWTAPVNTSGRVREYTIEVVAACDADGSVKETARFTQRVRPAEHTMTITKQPFGYPNPVASGGDVACIVEAEGSYDGDIVQYAWSATGAGGAAAGSFDYRYAQKPTWRAPANTSDYTTDYTIQVIASCAKDPTIQAGAVFVQRVTPVEHTMTITRQPSGAPNPVASGGDVACSVVAEDSREGHNIAYRWSATDADGHAAGSFSDSSSQNPTWQAPTNTSNSVAQYSLAVVASCPKSAAVRATASFIQSVNPTSHTVTITTPPAGDPNPVASGGDVACSVAAEDSRDGHTVKYSWTATDESGRSAGSFDNPNSQNPTWRAPENTSASAMHCTIQVVFSCSQNEMVNATASFTQHVNPTHHAVTITTQPSGTPNPVPSSGRVACTVVARDSHEGHTVTYAWTATDRDGRAAGSFDNPNSQTPTWQAPENTSDSRMACTIQVVAACAHDETVTATASFTQRVSPTGHTVTIITQPSGDPNPVASGGHVACNVLAQDSRRGHTVTYVWTATDRDGEAAGSFDNPNSQNPTWTAPTNTSDSRMRYSIQVVAACARDETLRATVSFTQQVNPAVHTVAVTTPPSGNPNPVSSGGVVVCNAAAEDSREGHTVTYMWTATDPDGNPAGGFGDAHSQTAAWTAPVNRSISVTQYTIQVVAACADDETVRTTASFYQRVTPAIHAVTITTPPSGTPNPVAPGGRVACSVTAEDSRDGHTVVCRWTATDAAGSPAGSFDDPASRNATWTAPIGASAALTAYTIQVVAACADDVTVNAAASFTQRVGHAVSIIAGPFGDVNPVKSGGEVVCSVVAACTMEHALTYRWSATGGTLSGSTSRSTTWTAPENTTGARQQYTISVTASCATDPSISDTGVVSMDVLSAFGHHFGAGTRMIGIPGAPAGTQGLVDLLTSPQVVRWNPATDAYEMLISGERHAPGCGYWGRFSTQRDVAIPGTVIEGVFDYPVATGWNLVSSPYTHDLRWEALLDAPTLLPLAWTDQGSGYVLVGGLRDGLCTVDSVIHPWWGYWVYSTTPGIMRWNPKRVAVQGNEELLEIGRADAGCDGWQVQLVAQAGARADACNYLGVADPTTVEALTIPNPPPLENSVDIHFPTDAGPMAADIHTPAATQSWEFVVTCGVDAPVTLSFPDLTAVPAALRLTLCDLATNETLNMRTTHTYSYRQLGERRFRVEATRGNGNTLVVSGVNARQAGDSGVSIAYTLSAAADVNIEMRNISGRLVSTVPCDAGQAGLNSAFWNLRNAAGARVPAGTYLCSITARADDGTQTSSVRALSVGR